MAYHEPTVSVYQRLASIDINRLTLFDDLRPVIVGRVSNVVSFSDPGSTYAGVLDYIPANNVFSVADISPKCKQFVVSSYNKADFGTLSLFTVNDYTFNVRKEMNRAYLELRTEDSTVHSEGMLSELNLNVDASIGGQASISE